MRFGRLTFLRPVKGPRPGVWAELRCDCGELVQRAMRDLRAVEKRGYVSACPSCTAKVSADNGHRNRTHGLTVTARKLYDVHRQMMRRCYDPNCADWPAYGGRGIGVCVGWSNPISFVEWALSSGYREGLTIERRDVNGNYEPSNCTWIENERQAHNTRRVTTLTLFGQTMVLSGWAKESGISVHTIKGRLKRGWDPARAVIADPKGKRRA